MTKAIILASQRSGSTFLQDCLTTHPQIHSVGELLIDGGSNVYVPDLILGSRFVTKTYRFMISGAWYPTRLMTRFFESGERPVKVFKAMYNHIANPWSLGYLREHTEIRILHLRRHNMLKQYVSHLLLARKRVKKWEPHAFQPIPVVTTRVEPGAALDYLRKARAMYEHYDSVFAHHQRLPLVYEKMIDGQVLREDVGRAICDFLGVPPVAMKSRLLKMNPDSLHEMVTNYDELARALKSSEFADLLDQHS